MRRGIAVAVALLSLPFVTSAANGQSDDPLAPARGGAFECIEPNIISRSCGQFTVYSFSEGGGIAANSIAILSNEPQLLLYGTEQVYVRDGMVCSRMTPELFASLRFTLDGEPAPTEMVTELRALFVDIFAGINETCSRSSPAENNILRATVYADGVERPELSGTSIWVRPEDGYTLVAPPEETAT